MEIAILTGIMILGRYVLAYDVVNRCPASDKETWTNRGKTICKGLVGQRYHCFKGINGSFLEMCIHPKGFQSRECPYFDPNSSSSFKYGKCNVIHGQCPPGGYYPSYHLYKYTACLYSPTTAVNSSRDYNTEMTQPTQSDRKQRTKGTFNMTATTEPEIRYVTILRKIFGKKNYTACLYSPTTVVYSSSDYSTEMTQPTQSDRKQRTKGIVNITATTEPEIRYVTILRKFFGKKNYFSNHSFVARESATSFASDILKGILTFSGGVLIASVCFITYVIKRKKRLDLRMTYSNAVAFKDNTENIYDDIVEAPLEIPKNNTSSLEQSAYLEPNEGLLCHVDTSCHRVNVYEKENTDMQLCDVEMEKADNTCNTEVTEVTEVKDTAPSLLGFL